MLTFSKLEKKGNLGNQFFQIAAVIGIASENQHEFSFPKWSANNYFEEQLPIVQNQDFLHFTEKQYHFKPLKFDRKNYDLEGWFQSEKYFDRDLTKKYFTFKRSLVAHVKEIFSDALSKNPILISIRRGDFVDHPDYFQLPVNYYINALNEYFTDWRSRNVIILSDDIDYCKFHFSFLPNSFFANQSSGIEQIILATLCDDFIISNSTFSWWCAWLGEKENSKVIRPRHNFTTEKNRTDNDKDYFPQRWISAEILHGKISLTNTTLKFSKKNDYLKRYYFENFDLTKVLDSGSLMKGQSGTSTILHIFDYFLPPFCLSEAVHLREESNSLTVGKLKGQPILISKFLDFSTLSHQYDFGIFAKILKRKNKTLQQEPLFLCIPSDGKIVAGDYSQDYLRQIDGAFELYTYAGKSTNNIFSEYFWLTKKRLVVTIFKKNIKKILGIRK